MSSRIVVGPFSKGQKTDVKPFYIDNDSFPALVNAYQWRGRVKRKRGTSLLGRLQRYFSSTNAAYNSGSTTITLNGSGVGNILTGFSLQTNGNIIPGTVTITVGLNVYTDPAMDGTLSPSGSINYASGQITILAEAGNNASAVFRYYPDLPVLGLEDLLLPNTQFPGTLGFDTTYAYDIGHTTPALIHDVSWYKNPATATYAGYTTKSTYTRISWNGEDYRQFWTINYQGALWATNGVNVPFDITKIAMQYKPIVAVTVTSATTASLNIVGHGLVVGDFVYINEVVTTTGINFQTGYVTTVTDVDNVIVTFPNANIAANGTGGIAQYLTSRSDTTKDCLRWYDGDPTNGSSTAPVLNGVKGWVNFMPPLSENAFSIADLPEAIWYLIGAKLIVPFKDRLLFIGPVVQTSAANSQVYLPDTIVWSQNGTPYYTCSFDGSATSADTVFNPILVPTNQTATAPAWFSDSSGFGGYLQAGLDQNMNTVSTNEDVLIIGLDETQTRLVYTGNDFLPFNLFVINSELGSSSSFSAINMDRGVMTRGNRGYVITSQVEAQRFDLDIPDEVFQTNLQDNGTERISAQRDFINEWVYFTYRAKNAKYKFPNQTLLYNYRDHSWAIFNECYTTYGQYQRQTGFIWATVGLTYPTWNQWNDPWNAGTSNLLQPQIIAGNQQGFILVRDDGTGEGDSLYIRSISGVTITSPDHCLNQGDFIVISGCLGTVGSALNGNVYKVGTVTQNTFTITSNNPPIGTGTYLGGGVIKRLYRPFIQTKQFPAAWDMGRKTRIGSQRYLFTTTETSQVTLLIYLSQNADDPYNSGPIFPEINSVNDALIYSTVLYTCPESTNLGLTPANSSLVAPTAIQQSETWHRLNTSLIGDTVQVAITLSDEQMFDSNIEYQTAEIELHGFILDIYPSQVLV